MGHNQRSRNTLFRTVLIITFIIIFISLQMNFMNFLDLMEQSLEELEVMDSNASRILHIVRRISRFNRLQSIYNEESFGPLQNDSVVIVIQVHNRLKYLEYLIKSLSQAPGISQTLLVFSHDYYDEEINYLVQSVKFCKVIQIFYPYSIQTHPYKFPGEDPNDCPRNIDKQEALMKKCNNALYPDRYGHYREAKFTQPKHHWWWKANRVFDQLKITKNHSGLVVFLEEDFYVAEDFIYVLKLMAKTCSKECRLCNVLSLGTRLETSSYFKYGRQMEIVPWIGSRHNTGIAFNRSTWRDLLSCADFYCKYDDYNFDWSLQHVSYYCRKRKFHAMVARGARVFHVGECGVHYKKNDCVSNDLVKKVNRKLWMAKRHLYPDYLKLTFVNDKALKKKRKSANKINGGWGDRRDHELCMNMSLQFH